jgi:hypothetical protein
MSNITTFEIGMKAVERMLENLGASNIEIKKEGNKKSIQFYSHDEKSSFSIVTRSKTAGTWQTSIDYGKPSKKKAAETDFWIFVDLDNIDKPKFYIVPKWWITNNIYETHQAYLSKYMGTRKYNPDSKHHAVQLSRIKQWENRWDLFNLKT